MAHATGRSVMRRLGGALAIEPASSPGSSNTSHMAPRPTDPNPSCLSTSRWQPSPRRWKLAACIPRQAVPLVAHASLAAAGGLRVFECSTCGLAGRDGRGIWGYLCRCRPICAGHRIRNLTVHQSQPLAAHFPSQQRAVRPRTDDPHTHCVGPPRLTLCSASRFDTLFDVKTGASPLRSA